MRVILIGTRGFPNVQGGVEKHCESLSVGLVANGCEVIVFTRRPYVDRDIKEFQGVKLVSLPAPKNKFFENILHTFLGILVSLRHKPEILHFQAVGSALLIPLARIMRLRVVFTTHGSNYRHLKWNTFAKLVLRFSEYLGVTFAHEVIAISQTIAQELKENYHRDAVIIPNGVPVSQIVSTQNVLQNYGLKKDRYILSVGRLVPEKGFHNLIRAFNMAGLKGYKLVIAGDADHEDTYSRNLKKSALENKDIVLTGFITTKNLQELYSHAALFVLPSYYEGMPISLLEALSYGIQCIASDIPGNRSLNLAEGQYFMAGDEMDICKRLKEFLSKPLTEKQKKDQIEKTTGEYSWDVIAQRTFCIYTRLLKRRR